MHIPYLLYSLHPYISLVQFPSQTVLNGGQFESGEQDELYPNWDQGEIWGLTTPAYGIADILVGGNLAFVIVFL